MAQGLYSSIFGELTKQVQVRIDTAAELRKRMFDATIYSQYLDWDVPTIGLNFEEVIGSANISVAAATMDSRGKEPVIGSEGFKTIRDRVLSHQLTYSMPIEDYRRVLQLVDSKRISDNEKMEQMIRVMLGNVQTVVNGIEAKHDMMFLGALSNKGVLTFDATNNPEGGMTGTIDYGMPEENIATATKAWTNENIDAVDCFDDIQEMLDVAQDKVMPSKILLAQNRLSYILRNKKMKLAVFGSDKSSTPLMLSTLNEFMKQNGLPVFEVMRRIVRISDNGVIREYKPFNDKNLVFIPEGKLGTIKNAYADNELREENGVAYSNYGRIRISQWGVGESQNSNGVEFTKAQVLSLPVITEIDNIYSLSVEE